MADGYRILVVEDDAAVRRLVTTTLDLHGYAYREARTASQALLELSSQPPDLAILDLGLPDGDGVEVIRTLRGMKGDADEAVYRNGSLRIDYAAGSVWRDDEEIHLTPFEYKLLCLLARNTGKVLTHNYLLKEVWGTILASDRSSLRVFMATLRKKIEPDPANPRYIQTHVGVGYRMMRVE